MLQLKSFRLFPSVMLITALILTGTIRSAVGKSTGSKVTLPVIIYNNGRSPSRFVASGWFGDTGKIHYDPNDRIKAGKGAHPSAKICLRIHFSGGSGWGGVVWQNPANNWGDNRGGIDLTGAKRLVFWARAKHHGLVVKFGYGLIGKSKTYHDSSAASRQIKLTTRWKKYVIPLSGNNMSRIITGFYWSAAADGAPFTFYLDGIEYRR